MPAKEESAGAARRGRAALVALKRPEGEERRAQTPARSHSAPQNTCSVATAVRGPLANVTNNVGSPGSVAAFRVDPTNGAMTFLQTALAGFNPQGIALTPDGRYAIVINGTSNNVVEEVYALPIMPDGSFGAAAAPTLYPDGNSV